MSPEVTTPGSPMITTPAPGKAVTTRKCANCGQAGHIRKLFLGSFLNPDDLLMGYRYE